MENIDIKKALDFAFGRLKANASYYIFGFLITILAFSALTTIVVAPVAFTSKVLNFFFSKGFHWMELVVFVMTFAMKCLVLMPLLVGYLRGIGREARGETATFMDLFSGFSDYLSIVIFSAVMGCLLIAGFSLFVIPGLLLCPVLSLGLYYLATGVTGTYGIDAIVKAFKNWSLRLELVILLVLCASFAAGVVVCCVGLVLTIPIGVATVWHLCNQYATGESPKAKASQDEIGTPS